MLKECRCTDEDVIRCFRPAVQDEDELTKVGCVQHRLMTAAQIAREFGLIVKSDAPPDR